MVVKDLIQIFKNIAKSGIAILFVEQNVRLALSMADRGYILESGRLVITGEAKDLIDNEKVKKFFWAINYKAARSVFNLSVINIFPGWWVIQNQVRTSNTDWE